MEHQVAKCSGEMLYVKDAIEFISGKWKLLILISITSGNRRFREIERSIPKITSKVLAKELKDLEQYKLIERRVHAQTPVLVEYLVTPYTSSLAPVIDALNTWGKNHREIVLGATTQNAVMTEI